MTDNPAQADARELCECGFPQSHPKPHEHSSKRESWDKLENLLFHTNLVMGHINEWHIEQIMHLLTAQFQQGYDKAKKEVALTEAERWEYESLKKERSIALDDYHEFGKAPVGSPERMAAYISYLSLHNLREGAKVLKDWRQEVVERVLDRVEAIIGEDEVDRSSSDAFDWVEAQNHLRAEQRTALNQIKKEMDV